MPDPNTVLVISTFGVPRYSARGLVQTLAPIATALQRTINGELQDVLAPQFRKFASSIIGTDQTPPANSGLWPGQLVTVDCIAELAYLTATGSAERAVVASRTEGEWTFFRPRLSMRIADWSTRTDEWGATVGWQLDLLEA